MIETSAVPKVSIGMPVYNGERLIRAALDSLLAQSFTDYELIISDNGSTDGTERICREYAARDKRIKYVRQSANIGGSPNFKFVLDEARGEYFMWSACDDIRSPDFVEVNLRFLSDNLEYVASTSPNGFEGRNIEEQPLVKFALDGELIDRYVQFFDNCFSSQGILYSLMRTQIFRGCELVDEIFPGSVDWLGFDWAIALYLASKGKVNRASDGYTILGVKGISSGKNIFRVYSTGIVEKIFPFYRLTRFVINLTSRLPLRQKARIFLMLVRLNVFEPIDPIRRAIFYAFRPIYRVVFKSKTVHEP